MADFIIRFLICNIFISLTVVLLSIVKNIFRKILCGSLHYNLWLIFLCFLAIPLLPSKLMSFPLPKSNITVRTIAERISYAADVNISRQFNDFSVSAVSGKPWEVFLCIWIAGIIIMAVFVVKAFLRLQALKKSSLPLQSMEVKKLYELCKKELKVKRNIPLYSTAFLKSPIIAGFLRPRIYLPIHLVSDCKKREMRYILLHELYHYKNLDTLANFAVVIARALYWFNPFIWYAFSEMHNDREIACDTAVLKAIGEEFYDDYGNFLINFAEKLSAIAFADGIGGTMKQLKMRIFNIASYEKPTFTKKLKALIAFTAAVSPILATAPVLSAYGVENSSYHWKADNVSYVNLSDYFGQYEGSFALYDLEKNHWSIYNIDGALSRSAPNSTYKIYTALFGLEEGIISPNSSFMEWNGQINPYDEWNTDQDLYSAMSSSVNWYFQEINSQLGSGKVYNYIHKIGYGNENLTGDFSTYWLQSSLKISPVEQVELLTSLCNNEFGFNNNNIEAVKKSMLLSSDLRGTLYGKTGTGQVDGKDINGWFIGFTEGEDKYVFSVNISGKSDANGKNAYQIAMSIISKM